MHVDDAENNKLPPPVAPGPDEVSSTSSGPPMKVCEGECGRTLPLTEFNARQRSCRDCAGKVRRAKAAEKPSAAEKRVRKLPVEYTPELGRLVCDHLAEGETLADVCVMPGMPARRDIARWLTEVDEFHIAYSIALAVRGDARVDAIAKNTRDMRSGALDVAIGREVNANLKWLAGKDNARYADKVTIDQTIRPGQPEPEAEQVTKAWIARAIAASPNVIELKPEPSQDEEGAA